MENMPVTNSLDDLVTQISEKGDPYQVLEQELGPSVADYRLKWKETGEGKLLTPYPLHLNIELNYGCNLRCAFCIFSLPAVERNYRAKPKDRISFNDFCKIIDEGVKNGLSSVALNGYNEPLLCADISDYISYARDKGVIDISLHTNGIPLTEALSKKLIDSGLTIIMFSLDAAKKETYEKIRQGGKFEKAVENVLRFIEIRNSFNKRLPLIRVSFVENKINSSELPEFISFWKNKVDYFMIQSFANPFVGKSNYNKAESDYRLRNTPFSFCGEPYQRLMITCDGNVMPCCSGYGLELVIGNIYKNSISDIWNSQEMKEFRKLANAETDEQPEACKKCRVSVVGSK